MLHAPRRPLVVFFLSYSRFHTADGVQLSLLWPEPFSVCSARRRSESRHQISALYILSVGMFHTSWCAAEAAPAVIKVHQSALADLNLTANEAPLHQTHEGHPNLSLLKSDEKSGRIRAGHMISRSAWRKNTEQVGVIKHSVTESAAKAAIWLRQLWQRLFPLFSSATLQLCVFPFEGHCCVKTLLFSLPPTESLKYPP